MQTAKIIPEKETYVYHTEKGKRKRAETFEQTFLPFFILEHHPLDKFSS
jgi:hypothetical protein